MPGQVTDTDCLVWQCRAATVLREVLGQALKVGLPPAIWQIGPAGGVVGQFANPDMEARMPAFVAWADFLGIDAWKTFRGEGVTYLHGVARRAFAGITPGRCQVVITTQIYDVSSDGSTGEEVNERCLG